MARRKHYKNEGLIKFLVVIGGILGLASALSSLLHSLNVYSYYYFPGIISPHYYGVNIIIILIIGVIVSILTIMCGIRKESKNGGEILPFEWWMFLILAILLIVFGGGILAGVIVIIAFLIALIEDL